MGLESSSFLHGLDANNPLNTDPRRQGANHLRLIKAALKGTFPGLNGRAFRTQSKSVDYTFTATDNMTSIVTTAAGITLTLLAAATAANGWCASIRTGSDPVTLAPNGTDNINGANASVTIPGNGFAEIVCTGVAYVVVLGPRSLEANFASGTRMLFQQTAAPTGWTKQTDAGLNDTALRLVTGSVVNGGAVEFTTVFGASKATASHVLTTDQIPSHSHGAGSFAAASAGAHTHTIPLNAVSDSNFTALQAGQAVQSTTNTGSAGAHTHTITGSSAAAGSGDGHAHNLTLDLKYTDIIVAQKD